MKYPLPKNPKMNQSWVDDDSGVHIWPKRGTPFQERGTVAGLRLDAVKFTDPIRWGWVLTDEASGVFISSHMMQLDDSAWQFDAFSDLAGYLSWHAAPDRRAQDEARIVSELGEWIGSHVLGPVASAMVQASPVTVRVVALEAAAELLARPLELAHVGGKPIAAQDVTLVMDTGSAESAVRPVGERLRVLGLFSLPEGGQTLNLRRERHSLVQLIRGIARGGKAVDVQVLQYGVTRDRLREILAEDEGWDVIHISGHGSAGQFLLETDVGEPDHVTASELAELLDSARGRLKLVTISACWSAAVAVTEQRRLIGVPAADGSTPAETRSSRDGVFALESLAAELNRRNGCAVLAMRYPVDDQFALALSRKLYALLAGEGQPLPEAVRTTLRELAPGPDDAEPGSNAFPPLSLAAPALFGSSAIGLRVAAPDRGSPETDDPVEPTMPGFPPQPERFVGRTGVMTRASAALAVGSGVPGVLLFGMPGGGKTACALELAYGHEHAFDRLVWYKAPDQGTDIAGALTDFALTLERGLNGPQMVLAAYEGNLAAFLPRLTRLLQNRRLLIVIDNADSLLTDDGCWGDERWGDVIDALAGQPDGLTRLILTSRRVPARIHGLRVEAVGMLSADESLLLAREFPNFNALARGETRGMERRTARRLARRTFQIAQGHPKMLELADRQAAHPKRLSELMEADPDSWRAGPPRAFFDVEETAAGEADYLDVFAAWTHAVSETLTDGERDLFWVLCCLIEPDRIRFVLDVIWPGLWKYLGREGPPPDLDSTLVALTARGLAEADGKNDSYKVQIGIVLAGRNQAGKTFNKAVAAAAGEYWITALRYTSGESGHGVRSDWRIRALQSSIFYHIEYEDWKTAAAALALSFIEFPSRTDAATVTALMQEIIRHEPSTANMLTMVMQKIDPTSVEAHTRDGLVDAVARSDYREATALGARLIDIYRASAQLQEALVLADQTNVYCRQAGLGPRTQIFHELQRLQVLLQMGNARSVLSEIQQLRDRIRNVAEAPGPDESVEPWVVRELLLETGRSAALQLSRWADALDFSADLVASLQARRTPANDIAQAKFGDYDALLGLGRINEALEILLSCRQAFQDAGDITMLGKTFGALADVEDERGRGDTAISMQRDALRYAYLSGETKDIAVSYQHFGLYLHRASQPALALALASHLAAALICALTDIRPRYDPVLHAAINLHELGADAVPPGDVAELCRQVGDIPGTDLPRLIATLSPVPDTAERALHELIAQAQALAAKGGPDLT